MEEKSPHDLIVILGPTATGKTKLAVQIANKINSEIISADSRQVYKGMNIGTGKDLHEYTLKNKKIPYHLIDIISPQNEYNVLQFQKDAYKIISKLKGKNKIPIICGGTGLYIESVLLNYNIPSIAPNYSLRNKLSKSSLKDLMNYLKKMNKNVYNPSYHNTKRRIIRQIELLSSNKNKNNSINRSLNNPLVIGLKIDREILLEKIKTRLDNRFNEGMIEEVERLIEKGITFERLKYFGLEYKLIGKYLFKELTLDDMKQNLLYAINKFSKRQMTFFRRMEKRGIAINWIKYNCYEKIDLLVNQYLYKK